MSTLTTLVSFGGFDEGDNGANPDGSLVTDAAGDIFGTTFHGGANDLGEPYGVGTVFEIAKTSTGYTSTPTTLVSFDIEDGAFPYGNLIIDATGDLIGTTVAVSGTSGGSVFEVVKTDNGYSDAPTTLVNTLDPYGDFGLVSDAAGDLFFTYNHIDSSASVDELIKTVTGYPSTSTTLINFSGDVQVGDLVADAAGNLFGIDTTGSLGAVFEIAKTSTGYADAPTTLATFEETEGQFPVGSLTIDAAGDIFGTTELGFGGDGLGTVFEVAKTSTGYASTPTTLVSFDGDDGAYPFGGVIIDAAGDLFGTTTGVNGDGTVYEITKTPSGYATAPTILVGGLNDPQAGLLADDAGDLFGTTYGGGTFGDGTVFELTDSGYQVACYCPGTRILTDNGEVAVENLAIGDRVVTPHGGDRPIKWIGRRSYDGRFVAGQPLMLPVCFKRGAVEENVPSRDLWVSPGHAVCIDGVLVPAWLLANGVSIVQAEKVASVTYVHVEFDDHEVIFAEGCPAESFLDDNCRNQFQNAAEFHALYPGREPGASALCLPRVEDGFHLQAIHRRLAARAGVQFASEQSGPLRGFVDVAGPEKVAGWARNEAQPEVPVCLDIFVDGRRVMRALANRYRADLREAGVGGGKHSFEVRLPAGACGRVEVRRSADQAPLALTEAAAALAA